MDYRSIAAIAVCVLFYLGYTHYLNTKYPNANKPGATAPADGAQTPSPVSPTAPATPAAPGATTAAPAAVAEVKRLDAADLKLESDQVIYRFSQDIGGIASISLKHYTANKENKEEPDRLFELLDGPLAIQGVTDIETMSPATLTGFSAERQGQVIKFARQTAELRITQEYRIPEKGFGGQLKVSFTNISTKALDLSGGVSMRTSVRPLKMTQILGLIPGSVTQRDQIVYNADGSSEWQDIEAFCEEAGETVQVANSPLKFFGIDRHYFLGVIEPKTKEANLRITHGVLGESGCPLTLVSIDKQGLVQPGETVSLDYGTFAGPKDMQVMQDHNPELTAAMHLGTFAFIGRPLLLVIQSFERLVGNYGVAIILLTLCLKFLFYPLVRASSISMHKMKKLNPQMTAMREKYKDDKQRQQQELMKFMVANKINPMKGCLPILPQIPVFFAFYQVLQTSIELRHAPFYGWIHDLSAMDPFFVTPLLMGVAMFIQQKLTPTTGMDKTQEKILMFMPIMFTVMMLTLPAGLTLYMLTNTVTGILQQKWLYRKLDKADAQSN